MARKSSSDREFEKVSLFVFQDHKVEGKVLLELNNQENDRAVAIVGAAFLQTVLLSVVQEHLRGDKSTFEKIFNPGKPVGDFGVQAELAYLLSLCDRSMRDDFLTIGRIRNWFAHKLNVDRFDMSLVLQECNKLKNVLPSTVMGEQPTTPRGQFIWCIATISGKLRMGPDW